MDEKGDVLSSFRAPRPALSNFRLRFGLLLVLGLCTLGARQQHDRLSEWFRPLHRRPLDLDGVQDREFHWDDLEPKEHLEYTSCYGGEYQCARLAVPMDWFNDTTDATVGLAVIRKPAEVLVTHPQYGGAVLLNPGGPGGSGVSFIQRAGLPISQVIDSVDGKYFDLISFDPRGVSYTTPALRCFDSPTQEDSWMLRLQEEGVYSASDAAFGRIWSMNAAAGGSCSIHADNATADIKNYVSTAYVARDMLEIVERHGQWREKEARRLLSHQVDCRGRPTLHENAVPEALRYARGEEKIRYWGFSYGTVLGSTFAAMFPDRVHRLVIDGVVDMDDYFKTLWLDNLVDTERALQLFYHHCARVGFPGCALAHADRTVTTAYQVEERTHHILESLHHNPLPVIGSTADVITYSDVKLTILGALYQPILMFPVIASMLALVERGEGLPFSKVLKSDHEVSCAIKPEGTRSPFYFMAIACTDGDDQSATTKDEFAEHVQKLNQLSPAVGEVWSGLRLQCIHYRKRAVHRFNGPWVGNTSHPILTVGNTADPVTPGRFAQKAAKGFNGAVALLQDSAGHCSLAASSRCTQSYIREYFQTGELPPPDTICPVDEVPFGSGAMAEDLHVDAEITAARERQRGILAALNAAGGGFRPHSFRAPLSEGWDAQQW